MPIKLFFLAVFVFLGFQTSSVAVEFVEGRHYQVLDTPKAKQKEIREYFSFYCKRCYSQEAFMKELEKDIPRRTKFVKHHLDGISDKTVAQEQLLTKALITAEKMRMKERVIDAIFEHIHVQNKVFNSVDDVKALFIRKGGSEFMFDSTYGSFSLDIKFEEAQKQAAIIKELDVKNFPALIINGKYKPLASRVTSLAEYKSLVYFLLTK